MIQSLETWEGLEGGGGAGAQGEINSLEIIQSLCVQTIQYVT